MVKQFKEARRIELEVLYSWLFWRSWCLWEGVWGEKGMWGRRVCGEMRGWGNRQEVNKMAMAITAGHERIVIKMSIK